MQIGYTLKKLYS